MSETRERHGLVGTLAAGLNGLGNDKIFRRRVFSGLFEAGEGGKRAIYWVVVLVLVLGIEAIALSVPAAGKPQAWHIDSHRNTIIAGFVLTAILILLFEVLF